MLSSSLLPLLWLVGVDLDPEEEEWKEWILIEGSEGIHSSHEKRRRGGKDKREREVRSTFGREGIEVDASGSNVKGGLFTFSGIFSFSFGRASAFACCFPSQEKVGFPTLEAKKKKKRRASVELIMNPPSLPSFSLPSSLSLQPSATLSISLSPNTRMPVTPSHPSKIQVGHPDQS